MIDQILGTLVGGAIVAALAWITYPMRHKGGR